MSGRRRLVPAWFAFLLAILFATGASASRAASAAMQAHAIAGMMHDCDGRQGLPKCPLACASPCALHPPETAGALPHIVAPARYFVAARLAQTSDALGPEPPPPRGEQRTAIFEFNEGFS